MDNENEESLIKYMIMNNQRKDVLNLLPEKIDTITIRLSNEWLNLEKLNSICWHSVKNGFSVFNTYTVEEGLNLLRRDSEYKSFFYCSLQFEFIFKEYLFKPNNHKNIFMIFWVALMRLEKKGFLVAPYNISIPEWIRKRESNIPENLLKIMCNYKKVATLTELDFAFDYPKNTLRCFNDCIIYKSTYYSNDRNKQKKKPKSKIICYDRIEKEKKKRQESFEKIEKIPYPHRLEIRLGKECEYLNLDNLQGNFYEVAFRFSPILAKIWRKESIALVPKDQVHIVFNHIQDLAFSGKTPQISKDLKKKEKILRNIDVIPDQLF